MSNDLGQCAKKVADHTGFHWFPCSRKAKELVGGKGYCRQHATIQKEREARLLAARMRNVDYEIETRYAAGQH